MFAATLASVLARHGLVAVDAPVARFAVAARQPWLTHAFEILTWAGSATALVPVLVCAGAWLRRTTASWRPLIFMAASLAGTSALSNAIKLAVARPRPDHPLVHAFGYAFPSGHAAAATAGWLSTAIAVGVAVPGGRVRIALVAAALLIAAIVGASRVYLRVHEATDVLGGWALGGAWVLVVALVTTRLAPPLALST